MVAQMTENDRDVCERRGSRMQQARARAESRAETRGNDVTRQLFCRLIGCSQALVPLLKRSRLRALSFCLDAVRAGPTYLGSYGSAVCLLCAQLRSLAFSLLLPVIRSGWTSAAAGSCAEPSRATHGEIRSRCPPLHPFSGLEFASTMPLGR